MPKRSQKICCKLQYKLDGARNIFLTKGSFRLQTSDIGFQISNFKTMNGFHFTKYDPSSEGKSRFEQLLDLLTQLLTYTSGDMGEAMQWLNELDKKYELTDDEYGMGDFIDELKEKGYITEDNQKGEIKITPKTEQGIRRKSLEEIFGKLKKNKAGRSS